MADDCVSLMKINTFNYWLCQSFQGFWCVIFNCVLQLLSISLRWIKLLKRIKMHGCLLDMTPFWLWQNCCLCLVLSSVFKWYIFQYSASRQRGVCIHCICARVYSLSPVCRALLEIHEWSLTKVLKQCGRISIINVSLYAAFCSTISLSGTRLRGFAGRVMMRSVMFFSSRGL